MKITARELMDLGLWERFCKETGIDEWSVNEGFLDPQTIFEWNLKTPEKVEEE